MDSNLNTQGAVERENKKSGSLKRKAFKRCMAMLLSATLTAGSCLPALAAEPQTEGQQEMSGAAMSSAEQAPEEEPEQENAAEEAAENEEADAAQNEEAGAAQNVETDAAQNEETDAVQSESDTAVSSENAEAVPTENEDADIAENAAAEDENAEAASGLKSAGSDQSEVLLQGEDSSAGETSELLEDYGYYLDTLDDGTEAVCLDIYTGNGTDIVVPGKAVVEGIEYPVTANSFSLWNGIVTRITFDNGFIFKNGDSFFAYSDTLEYVDISKADTSRVTSMFEMFADCNNLKSVNFGNVDVSNVESVFNMFEFCSSLEELDLSAVVSSTSLYTANNFVYGCENLRRLNLGNWDWTNVSDCYDSFSGCDGLEVFVTPISYNSQELALPCIMSDGNNGIHSSFYLQDTSVTLTKVEIPEWLKKYQFSLDRDSETDEVSIVLYNYEGEDTELFVPMTVTLSGKECIVRPNGRVWGSGVKSITFGEGTFDGSDELFYGAVDLEYLDLGNVHFQSERWYSEQMFQKCAKLRTICVPTGVDYELYLPGLFKDDDGNSYSMIPRGLSESKTLHAAEVSEWLEDYSYNYNEDDKSITLEKYCGDASDIVVPGSAVIDGEEITDIKIKYGIWNDTTAVNLKIEKGVSIDGAYDLFESASNLESIDLSEMDGIPVDEAGYMFYGCSSLKYLDLSGLDFSDCQWYDEILYNCEALETIITPAEFGDPVALPAPFVDAEGNVYTKMPTNLHKSIKLTKAEMSEWLSDYRFDLDGDSIVLNYYKKSLDGYYDDETGEWIYYDTVTVPGNATVAGKEYHSIVLSPGIWEGKSVEELHFDEGVALPSDCTELFAGYYALEKIDLSNVDVSSAENMINMFRSCDGLTEIVTPKNVTLEANLPGAYTDENGNIYTSLPQNTAESITLTKTTLGNWLDDFDFRVSGDRIILTAYHGDETVLTVPGSAQIGNKEYNIIELSQMEWNGVEELSFERGVVLPGDSSNLFVYGWALRKLDLSKVDTSSVTNMSGMFNWLSNLQELDLSGFDTSKVTNMESMFYYCENLTDLNVSSFDTANVTDMRYMFFQCKKLTDLNVSGFDTSNVKYTYSMFYGVDAILELDISSWDLHSLKDGRRMFSGKIPVIHAPANVPERCDLRALYMGSDGLTYNCLPINVDSSILLTWISESGDPTGSVSGDPSESGDPGESGDPSESGDPAQDKITIVSNPFDCEAKEGETASFHVVAEGNNLQYQWQWSADGLTWKNCTAAGFNTDTFAFTMAAKYAGRQYRCIITSGTQTAYTDSAAALLANTPEITVQPEDANVKEGETASFHVEASGNDVSYQWQYSLNGSYWSNCTGAGYNTDTFGFVMKEKYAGRQYRCVVTADGETLTSEAATANLKAAAAITQQPEDANVKAGERASFHVEASGNDVSYQWQYSLNGSYWSNCTGAGYNTDTFGFVMQEKYAGRQYRCVVTADGETLISDAATANLKAAAEITLQPEDSYAEAGERASFHVEAAGGEVSYQWQYSLNGSYWSNCTGAGYNTDTFGFVMQEKYAGRQYRCVVTIDGEKLTSDAATANLKETAGITGQPEDAAVKVGDTATFHVEFSGKDPVYQWQYSLNGTYWSNCKGNSYNMDTFSFVMQEKFAGRQYRCVIKAGGETYTSDSATVSLAEEKLITESPADVTVKVGKTASFHVETSASGVTYQWQWSSDGKTWKNCTGAGYNTNTFSFATQTRFSGRSYRCMVTDGAKTEYSESGLLTVTK